MWPYWLMFTLATLGVVGTSSAVGRGRVSGPQRLAWIAVFITLVLTIGFRHEVGGDWGAYERHFYQISRLTLEGALGFGDPGYYGLSWLVYKAGGNVYWLNVLCALLVVWGVTDFCKQQPLRWLALLVAIPYLLNVVAMGYSRQAAALGLVLIGLAFLGRGQVIKFVIYVFLGALFHKSAVLLLPIAALAATSHRVWIGFWVGIVSTLGAYLLVLDSSDALWLNYVEGDYQSEGGFIRVMMNVVPALILLLYRNRIFNSAAERKLWLWMAVLSLVTVPLVTIASTAVDRVALYFIPIQMFTFARLVLLADRRENRALLIAGVVVYCALVQFVWLNYASHAPYWLPYQNYLFITRS